MNKDGLIRVSTVDKKTQSLIRNYQHKGRLKKYTDSNGYLAYNPKEYAAMEFKKPGRPIKND